MQLSSLTSEKIDELTDECAKREKEYNDYCGTTFQDIWRREINEFIEAY